MTTLVLRLAALAAFVVLGIVWAADRSDTAAALWVVSFVVLAYAALAPAAGGTAGEAWERLPGPSKDPSDSR